MTTREVVVVEEAVVDAMATIKTTAEMVTKIVKFTNRRRKNLSHKKRVDVIREEKEGMKSRIINQRRIKTKMSTSVKNQLSLPNPRSRPKLSTSSKRSTRLQPWMKKTLKLNLTIKKRAKVKIQPRKIIKWTSRA